MNKGKELETFDPAAVIDGMLLMEGVGLFMTGSGFWSGGCAKLAELEGKTDTLAVEDIGLAEVVAVVQG